MSKVKAVKLRKRQEAEYRKTEHELMAPEAKLRKLDRAPGASTKERARIQKHIDAVNAAKVILK
jgi:hypothetical protein